MLTLGYNLCHRNKCSNYFNALIWKTSIGIPYFSFVHEIHDGLNFPSTEILKNDDGMLARIFREDTLEKRRAGAEHDLVSPHRRLGADQRHVYQSLCLQEGVEGGQDVTLVVVPSEGVMWLRHFRLIVAVSVTPLTSLFVLNLEFLKQKQYVSLWMKILPTAP